MDNYKQEGELFIFLINKSNMKKLLVNYRHYAHGTKLKYGEITSTQINQIDNKNEYALRPKYGDNCWKSLLEMRINNLER